MNCEDCKFYKEHIYLGAEGSEWVGSSCEILGKYENCILKKSTAIKRLNAKCPFPKDDKTQIQPINLFEKNKVGEL